MTFNSLAFVVFFPLAVLGYFALPKKWQWAWLLAASYFFYGWWRADYLLLIAFSTLVDYGAALAMGRQTTRKGRFPYLLISLGSNLGLLFLFKYYGFFSQSAQAFLGLVGSDVSFSTLDVLLPVGISFYTFQTLAYTIDVYRGRQEPERHLGIFALYVSFFPQLVAGPIERSQHLLPQFHARPAVTRAQVSAGLRMMLWGLFMKCVVADRLAPYVDQVYSAPEAYGGLATWAATYAFAFQIYADFAGYSLVAIGAAYVLGYDLMTNFKRPYFSKNISEFWRRWHISLSSWFRDYLYIPLGGNRVSKSRFYLNILIVFAVSGLWHGAAWPFVVWGALHGLYLIVGAATGAVRDRLWTRFGPAQAPGTTPEASGAEAPPHPLKKWTQVFVTFHLALFAWIFFRARTMADAWMVIRNAVAPPPEAYTSMALPGFTPLDLALCVAAVLALLFVDLLERRKALDERVGAWPLAARWSFYVAMTVIVITFGRFGETVFLYFQF